jgi:para-nitrobenzyl esterase
MWVGKRFGPHADAVLRAYPADAANWARSARDIMHDAGFAWHTWVWADLQTTAEAAKGAKSKAFIYYFNHRQPPRRRSLQEYRGRGAHRKDDLRLRSPQPAAVAVDRFGSRVSAYHVDVLDQLREVRRSDWPGVPEWPVYSARMRATTHFNVVPEPAQVANLDKLKVPDVYFAWRRTPEVTKFGAGEQPQ